LPKILQGESMTPPPKEEELPLGFEIDVQDKENTSGKMKEIELPLQETEVPHTEKSQAGKGKELEIPSEIPENITKKVGGTASTELGSPITSLTPLQSTYGNPQEGVQYVSDLEPISRDEIPPSNYFFSKKRKAILKQEMHPRGDMMIKKHKITIDGQKLKEGEFATEIAGTMGALASVNLYSVGSLTTILEKKEQMIAQL
jgi:hypothetical protein